MSNLVSVFSNLNLTRTLGGRYYCSHLTDKENEASKAEYLHKGSRESISDLNPVSLVAQAAQVTKNPSVMDPSWVRSLGWDDPLEKEMATQSSILAWKVHGQRSLEVTVHGLAKSRARLSD